MDANFWTIERLSALPAEKLESLKINALAKSEATLLERIDDLQNARRKDRGGGGTGSPVIGFHFVCPDDYEVDLLADGRFWSGVWAVATAHCAPAVEMKGYVALHKSRSVLSHRQGTVIDWKTETRTKGKTPMGVSFLVRPFEESLQWFGEAAGERGYRRVDDKPAWLPR